MGRSSLAAALAVTLSMFGSPLHAAAAPDGEGRPSASEPPARVERVVALTDRRTAVSVYSPAMNRVVLVHILHPASDAPRPSLYLLDGVSAGSESGYTESTWTQKTDVAEFFADKDVNVVLPVGGAASYYTDWANPDPVLGQNRWETFLTRELPPVVDGQFRGNGVDAVAGLSMGAQGAMMLATRHPDRYRGVAALSGCMDTGRPESEAAVRGTIASKGGDADNMWGRPGDPAWAEHDPSENAEALRGKHVFVSTGNGLPGPYELGAADVLEKVAVGGPLEAAANACTHVFRERLDQLGIPATFLFRPYGTHSWPYWRDDLRAAWPTLDRALDVTDG